MKKIIYLLTLIICTQSCAQNKINMEEEAKRIYNATPKYQEQPLYGLQVDKMGCRLSIKVNDMTLDNYFDKGGYSSTETLNTLIIKSGKQTLTYTVYPREGKEYLDDLTRIQLQLFYVKHKGDPMDTYQVMQTIELPKDLKDKKLPFYTATVEFNAQVPWDESSFYDHLTDLRTVPNIEQKVLAKYEEIRQMYIHNEQEKFFKIRFNNAFTQYESLYMTEKEIKEYLEFNTKRTSPLKNKEVLPIEHYQLIFERNGTVASLVDKNTREGVIVVEYGDLVEEGEYKGRKQHSSSFSPVLILPKGKTELEIF